MSVKLLFELRERLHYTAIAGTLTAGEDFRLKNVLSQFEQIAGSAPIFAKINEMLKPLRNPEGFTGSKLMDAASLVDAVCITQAGGLTKADPEKEAAEAAAQEKSSAQEERKQENLKKERRQFKYSEIKPFLDAFTSKGSGRFSLISDAYQENNPALSDYRILPALIQGLGDSYSEMADLCMKILSKSDESVIPLLKEGFQPDGKKDMARRVSVIAAVGGASENEFYQELLNTAKGPVRVAAIQGLVFDKANQELLIKLAKSERGDAKHTAMAALMKQEGEEKEEFFRSLITKDITSVNSFLYYMDDEETADLLADAIYAFCEQYIPLRKSLSKEDTEKAAQKLRNIGDALSNKYSVKLFECYRYLDEHKKELSVYDLPTFFERINDAVINTLFMRPKKELLDAARALGAESGTYLKCALMAGMIQDFAGSFDSYADRISDKESVGALIQVLDYLSFHKDRKCYVLHTDLPYMEWNGENGIASRTIELEETMDIRWIKMIATIQNWDSKRKSRNYSYYYYSNSQVAVLKKLANPENEEHLSLLKTFFRHYAEQGRGMDAIEAYLELGGTDCKGLIPALIKAEPGMVRYTMYRLYGKMPMTPDEIADELESIAQLVKGKKLRGTYLSPEDILEKAARFRCGDRSFLD